MRNDRPASTQDLQDAVKLGTESALTAAATDATTKAAAAQLAAGVYSDAADVLVEAAAAIDAQGRATAAQAAAIAASQPVHANLTAFAGLIGVADRIAYFTAASTLALATFTAFGRSLVAAVDAAAAKTLLSLVKSDVGLGSVDNVADSAKPVSTAQATAIGLKLDVADARVPPAPSTIGRLLYDTGSAWAVIAPGAAGKVLTGAGAAIPTWETPAGGGGPYAPVADTSQSIAHNAQDGYGNYIPSTGTVWLVRNHPINTVGAYYVQAIGKVSGGTQAIMLTRMVRLYRTTGNVSLVETSPPAPNLGVTDRSVGTIAGLNLTPGEGINTSQQGYAFQYNAGYVGPPWPGTPGPTINWTVVVTPVLMAI